MGYRSEVAFVVEFADQEGRDKVLAGLDAKQRELVLEAVQLSERRIAFHETAVKWYASKILPGILEGYADVDALEAFLDAAEAANELWEGSKGAEGVPSVGAFARVGEEYDTGDIETRYWGYYAPEGLSDPATLLGVSCSVWVGDDFDADESMLS